MTIVEINAPDTVASWFVAEIIFLCQRFLGKVHECSSNVEIGLEFIVEMSTNHGFGHHAEGIVLAADTNGCATGKDTFVNNADSSHSVVNGIVNIFNEWNATSSNSDRALRNTVA